MPLFMSKISTMKNTILILCLSLFAGCATIQPGNDPIVVNAERLATTSLTTFDTFVRVERENEADLKKVSPQIHVYANYIRRNGQTMLKTLRSETKAYKNNRTEENKADLRTAVAVVQEAVDQTKVYLTRVEK